MLSQEVWSTQYDKEELKHPIILSAYWIRCHSGGDTVVIFPDLEKMALIHFSIKNAAFLDFTPAIRTTNISP